MTLLRDQFELLSKSDAAGVAEHCYWGLSEEDHKDLTRRDVKTYSGKVRDLIFQGKELLIIHSDRLSAFDKLIGMVPYKGTILTDVAEFWLKETKKIIPTHLIDRPSERVLRVKKADPVKAEVIVRGYLAGSMDRAYQKGEREFCGVTLPDGLKSYGKLPTPIVTPTTKAEAFEHDENTTPAKLVAAGVCTKKEWDYIEDKALKVFNLGTEIYGKLGWILVDTKYEFGRTDENEIIIIDEVHTPDSSRLWVQETYVQKTESGEAPEMLDKENVRRYLMSKGYSGEGDVPEVPAEQLVSLAKVYLTVAEKLRGKEFHVDAVKCDFNALL
jgi:phosphoribosylaminoimidazole-succinocarboxamide synthase